MKTVAILQSPQHVALVYQCSHCGNKSKVVAEQADWEQRKKGLDDERTERTSKRSQNTRAHEIELDAIQGPDDLIALWSSLPRAPVREETMNSCGCDECKRRLYG